MWKVYKGRKWIGLIETNYAYARQYWACRRKQTGLAFHLRAVVVTV